MQVNITEAKEMVKDSGVTVFDVRSAGEYSRGHIQGAKLIPVDELSNRQPEIAALKDRPVLVYCHSGNRSSAACQILEKNGFSGIRNLTGGITAWKAAGMSIAY